MRIVHIGTSQVPVLHRFGGALQRRIIEMARLQAQAGHSVTILSPGDADDIEYIDNVCVRSFRLQRRRPVRDYEFLRRARLWASRQPSGGVLHAHGAPVAATALKTSFDLAVQSVDFFYYRGSSTQLGKKYYSARLADFDLNLAASAYCAKELSTYYPRIASRVRVLYNGVNRHQFTNDRVSADRARDKLGLPTGPLVVYLGRVCEQKGSDMLAPLALALNQAVPDATVVAAGPAEQFARAGGSPLIDDLTRAGVRCIGAIDEEFVSGLLSAAHVFVLPTRREEMFGMAALEALSSGTPVVASRLGGIPEAVGPGAELFPVGDVNAFVSAVLRVLVEPDLAKRLVEASTDHVKQFDWSAITNESLLLYANARQ